MSKILCRKAINFDLDTKALQKHYPKPKQWRKAYNDIEKFMKKEGFVHRQGSGYISERKLSMERIASISIKIKQAYPWLSICVNRFDVTDIGEQHDLTHLITGKSKEKVQEVQKETVPAQTQKAFYSVKQLKEKANEINRQPKITNTRARSNDREL